MPHTAKIMSTQFTDGAPNDGQNAVVMWRVLADKDLDYNTATHMEELRAVTCNKPLSLFPGIGSFSTSSLQSTMRLRSYQINQTPGGKKRVWDVVANYSSMYFWANQPASTGTEQLVLPVQVQMEAGERVLPAWRTASTIAAFATGPSHTWGKSFDIGGDKIDDAGKPTQVRVPYMDVRVSMIHDISNIAAGTLVTVYDKVNTVQGRWNSQPFLHWTTNTVYCTSASVSQVRDEYYRVTFNFRWDYWWDCNQIAKMDPDGHPENDASGNAKNVFWTGLKRGSADHNIIFNTCPNATIAKQMALEGCTLTAP